jgi:RND family efflux transporter MFP subunit
MRRMRHLLKLIPAILPALSAVMSPGEEIRIESAVVTPVAQVDLPSRVAGQLVEITVKEGDLVRTGDRISRVDAMEAELAIRKAQGALAIAKAEAANRHRVEASAKAAAVAHAELKRATEAGEKYSKSISQTELDRLRLTAEQSELQNLEARHDQEVAILNADLKELEVAMAHQLMDRHQLRTPIDGIVVELRRRLGEWVEPGIPVARIISIDPLRVEGFLDGRRLSRVKVGTPVRFVPASDERNPTAYLGSLSFVSPEANPVNGQVRIAATIDNPEKRLLPGLHGTMTILVEGENEPAANEAREKPMPQTKETPKKEPASKTLREKSNE